MPINDEMVRKKRRREKRKKSEEREKERERKKTELSIFFPFGWFCWGNFE